MMRACQVTVNECASLNLVCSQSLIITTALDNSSSPFSHLEILSIKHLTTQIIAKTRLQAPLRKSRLNFAKSIEGRKE